MRNQDLIYTCRLTTVTPNLQVRFLLFKYSGKSVKSDPKTRDKVSLCETLRRLRVLTVYNDIHQTLFVIYTCLGIQIYGKC